MIPFAEAVDHRLTELVADALEQLEGLPEDDLNHRTPRLGLEDVNTFYALATHLVGAGEYWLLSAAAGNPSHRDRPAEFRAQGDFASLRTRYHRWLADAREYLYGISEEDLGRLFVRGGDDPVRQTVAECIVHEIGHTGVHVGHLQLQRQIWNAERGHGASGTDRS